MRHLGFSGADTGLGATEGAFLGAAAGLPPPTPPARTCLQVPAWLQRTCLPLYWALGGRALLACGRKGVATESEERQPRPVPGLLSCVLREVVSVGGLAVDSLPFHLAAGSCFAGLLCPSLWRECL